MTRHNSSPQNLNLNLNREDVQWETYLHLQAPRQQIGDPSLAQKEVGAENSFPEFLATLLKKVSCKSSSVKIYLWSS